MFALPRFDSVEYRNVVEVSGPLHQVGRRIEAGECLEIVDKMRLIEVAAQQCDVRPIYALSLLDTPRTTC